jgi:hypothetical protein
MSNPIILYRSAEGLNTRDPATALYTNIRTGKTELAAAYNIDITESGRIQRRRGYTKLLAGSFHSLFCGGEDTLVATGTSLCRVDGGNSLVVLRNDLTEKASISWLQLAGRVYYMNGYQKGYIPTGGNDTAWVAGSYVGPETNRTFSDPPIGQLLGFHNSRVLVAVDNILFYSEPLAYGWFDYARNYIGEPARISMIAPVLGGVYIGTEQGVFYYAGDDITKAERRKITDDPPVSGTHVFVDASQVGKEGKLFGPAVVWTGQSGLYMGISGGTLYSLTSRKLVLPQPFSRGTAIVRDGNYLTLLQD